MSNRRTALHGAFDSNTFVSNVIVREITDHSFLDLRGRAENPNFMTTVNEILGLQLPCSPNTWSGGNHVQAFWTGPDQWLLLLEDGEEAAVEGQLRAALPSHYAVTDITSGQTIIEIADKNAELALQMAVPYDFKSLKPGQCVQTVFAKTQVLLWSHKASWRLIVRRSFADYLLLWLQGVRP